MTDANEMFDSIMRELNQLNISETDGSKEEQESLLFQEEETDFDDIPPSLLSYFETSRSRAAVCERLILEEPEDFAASHHTEDMTNLPAELDKDMMKLDEQVICDPENEENNTSTDTRLLPAPTETEALFTYNVSVCPNNEGEAGTDEYIGSEKQLSLNGEESKENGEYSAEREKRLCEEMKKEEQKRQIERDFQEELKRIMEAEKLHQKELELMEKRAQEKLEQEFLLQQALISSLQRRVEQERRMREEEQKRIKDEEDKRKIEEERIKIEAERKRMEEETRKKKEEERKIEQAKLKEVERKNEEEKRKRMEREEKRKREEDRHKIDLEKKRLEDGMRVMKEEKKRKKKEEVERMTREQQEEEGRKKIEEARKEKEKEERKMEEEISLKKEEEENMRIEEERRVTKKIEERKKQDGMRRKKEEQETDDDKKMTQERLYEEMKKSDKREYRNEDEEMKLEEMKKRGEMDRKKMEEEEKEEARKKEMERKKMEEKDVRKQEGENRKMKERLRPIEEDEKRRIDDESKTKEEEERRRQKEKMRSQKDDEDYKKSKEEMRLKEDKEGHQGYDVDNRKMEGESKMKDKENKHGVEKMKREEERKRVEAEKEQNGEEVGENKRGINSEKEMRLKEKEENKMRVVQDKEVRVGTANEVQEKREKKEHNSMMGQVEKKNPSPLRSESTICPTSTEVTPQQPDLTMSVSQTSADKPLDCENQASSPSTVSVLLPVCLPEHTEQKRLSWMKDCIPWSRLSLQNRRKQKGSVQSQRGPRRADEGSSLPPLCPDSLLQAGWKSLKEVTTVTLEDLPGCSLSTLAQCAQLRSLSLRRCGLKSLEGISQLAQLCHIDVQENDISFVDCENMTSLRVLRLSYNKLTSIHGLAGAENLDVLDLSHNSITRIAGLESVRRLQMLSVDHNQLISTKGLRDVYTLLHLDCSHNHLANVEGLENSALLNTLDLRANSLTEPPSLNNQVLLRELHLDDNSISSLQGLTACWLPLMQRLSVAQNRITQLPSMSDFMSLANLDLRFNCMSELQNLCESLEGCHFLREVQLTGNPLQQESGWRLTLQKAVSGLRAVDDQETDSSLSPPAVQQLSLAPGSFQTFCQDQLQQIHDLQQQHSRELSNASSSLDALKTSCQHFTEALQLATDQRFAHEYGDTTVADRHRAAGRTTPESSQKVPSVISNRDNIGCSNWTFDEESAAESRHDAFDSTGPTTGPTVSTANSGTVRSLATKSQTTSSNPEMTPVSNHQDLHLHNTAAVVIQQLWRKYRQKCGNISSPSTAEKGGGRGGDEGKPESGPSYINRSVVGKDYAATVIQAFWRGFALRRRLASALAAVTCPDTGEDDTFEEVDMDEFVFDEAALEKHWTLLLSEDSPPRYHPVSEQPLSLKPFPESSPCVLPPLPVWRSKEAWVAGEQVDSAGQTVSPVNSSRSKSPASASVVSGLSERSEKILEEWGFAHSHTALLMLKRAQKMKSKKQQHKRSGDPSVRLALIRKCSYQLGPVEAWNRRAQRNRNDIKVGEAEPGLQQAERTERVKQQRAQRWLHTQAAPSVSDSESVHFLPEISSDILNGGRVQLVADPGYTERLHHASGLWANSSLAAQPCKENNYPRRNSLGHAREDVPSPRRVASAPSKKERISFRDNPVQLSGGWGGGKKRGKVHK